MAAMRVYELARELQVTSKDVLGHLRVQGVELPSHMSKLSDEQVAQLTRHFAPSARTGPSSRSASEERAAAAAAVEKPAVARPSAPAAERPVVRSAEPAVQAPSQAPAASAPSSPAPVAAEPAAPPARPAAPVERPPVRTVPLDRIFGPGKGRRPGGPMHQSSEPSRFRTDEGQQNRPPFQQDRRGPEGPGARRPFTPTVGEARRPPGGPGPRYDRNDRYEPNRPPAGAGTGTAGPGQRTDRYEPGRPPSGPPRNDRYERPDGARPAAYRTDQQRPMGGPPRPPMGGGPPRPPMGGGPPRGLNDVWVEDIDPAAGKDKKTRAERVQGKAKDVKETERTAQWTEEKEGGGPKTERRRIVRTPDRRRPGTPFATAGPGSQQGGPRKKFQHKKQRGEVAPVAPPVILPTVQIPDLLSVREFADLTGKGVGEVIKELLKMGQMMTANMTLNTEMATKLGARLGVDVQVQLGREEFGEEMNLTVDAKDQLHRPPVITVMGHVDHGKTSLLDAIRTTEVAASEAGGITQHIGASVVHHNGQMLVFLDTPGHEAFTAMRSRGAEVTDIVVLVVAADDGVMPQTVEAVDHAKSAKVPIIVAVNKMDKPGADPARVKTDLARYGLNPEEWGGDTIYVEVSAKKLLGIDSLLDMLLLVAEVQELRANPLQKAHGTVIEAKLDRGRGPVATVLVQNGTLRVGDAFVVGAQFGKVRALYDDKLAKITEAGPSIPVEVLGLSAVPDAGDSFHVVDDEKEAKLIAQRRTIEEKRKSLAESSGRMKLEDLFARIQEGDIKELNIILKADVQGSVEALADALEKQSNPKVKVQVVSRAVGTVNESDVLLATTTNSIIVGYNVVPEPRIRKLAEEKGVDIRLHTIIYEALDEVRAAMEGLLDPTFREEELGRAEVRNTFSVPKIGTIAGCMVTDGKVARNANARLLREGKVVWSGKLASLKRFKDDAREVATGFECGIALENYSDIKVGDVIMFHTIVKEKGTFD